MIEDLETEKSVLAGIFQYGKDGYVDVSDILSSEKFNGSIHQVIYLVVQKTLEKSDKVDYALFLSSAHELSFSELIKDSKDLLDEIRGRKLELESLRPLAKKIAKLSLIRTSIAKVRQAQFDLQKLTGEETTNNILSMVEKPGYEIQRLLNSCEENGELIGEGIEDYIEELINNPNIETGISTGMKEFDKAIGGGLRRGGYTLVGARPKTGKSSLGINIALYVAERIKIPVLFLDTEMNPKQHYPRMIANLTSIAIPTIEHATFTNNGMLKSQIRDAGKRIKKLPITHERVAGKSFDEILSIARRWIVRTVGYHPSGKTNNCLIIYDYFKLMGQSTNSKDKAEWELLGIQCTQLSDFLGEYDVPCLALVQLNKEKDIAQSDRLIWLALAVATLYSKTAEEIVTDGYENGNRKIIFKENYVRFGEGLDQDDYINLQFEGNLCQMKELGTASEAKRERKIGKAGFDVDDSDEH